MDMSIVIKKSPRRWKSSTQCGRTWLCVLRFV